MNNFEVLPVEIIYGILHRLDDDNLKNFKLTNKYIYTVILNHQSFLLRTKLIQPSKKIFIDNLIKYNLYPYNLDIFYLTKFDIMILKFKIHIYLFDKVMYSKYNAFMKT